MKTICIFSPCRYTRNVIHSLCHDYANNGSLNGNKVRALSFSDVSVFNFFISTTNSENIEKVILVNSNNSRAIPGMLKLLHQTGLYDIYLIAGERYRNITESHMWVPAPQFIDIDEGLDLFREQLREFVKWTVRPEKVTYGKGLHLLNRSETRVLNCFLEGLATHRIQRRLSMSDKQVSYYKRRALQKTGASSLMQFAWLFGWTAPLWMQKQYINNKGVSA